MKTYNKANKPNPKLTSKVLSRIFLCWLFPLIWHSRSHKLNEQDLCEILPQDCSEVVTNNLEKNWKIQLDSAKKFQRKPKLLIAILKTIAWSLIRYAIGTFILFFFIKNLDPLTIGRFIAYFNKESKTTIIEACAYAFGIAIAWLLQAIVLNHLLFGMKNIGMRLRIACSALIYKKMLKLPKSTAQKVTGGKIINLLSNDVLKFEEVFFYLNMFWLVPIKVIVDSLLTWFTIGPASLIGIGLLILQSIPLQVYSGKIISILRRKIADKTDRRLLLTNEIIKGIQVIKMYTWEKFFEQDLFIARKKEMKIIAVSSHLKNIFVGLIPLIRRSSLFFTIITFVIQGYPVMADRIFAMNQYLFILNIIISYNLMRAIHLAGEAITSIWRIQELLLLEELKSDVRKLMIDDTILSLSNVSASWTKNTNESLFHKIDIKLKSKKLYAVVGPVSAGKTSFLNLILGELSPFEGEICLYGNLSYASQEPWIFNASIRSNILFGEPYNEERYRKVIEACDLLKDFKRLPYGDKTVTGNHGASLSGGQRARINLARAVYLKADLYLLDDPLSALDTIVARHIFENCINGLLKDKTCILVTHQLEYLSQVNGIMFINNGSVKYQENATELKKNNDIFKSIILNHKPLMISREHSVCNHSYYEIDVTDEDNKVEEIKETDELILKNNIKNNITVPNIQNNHLEFIDHESSPRLLYWKFFKTSGSYFILFASFLAFLISQILNSTFDYYIAYWIVLQTNSNSSLPDQIKQQIKRIEPSELLYILGFLLVMIIVLSITRSTLFIIICKNASITIHKKMVSSLIRTRMYFFNNNDLGQIINRFSKDLGTVDELLPLILYQMIEYFINLAAVSVQIIWINWWISIPIIIFGALALLLMSTFMKAIRYSKRLENSAKSTVFSHIYSSFHGMVTIRSSDAQSKVCREFNIYQDKHTKAYSCNLDSQLCFALWIEISATIFITIANYTFILLKSSGVESAIVGFTVSQILIICRKLSQGMRLYSEMETAIVSLERLFEYTNLAEEDEDKQKLSKKFPSPWPQNGEIKFDHVYLKYYEAGDLVLKDLYFTIEAGKKIRILGRTGAGKSSLVAALFRLAQVNGSIFIDGICTKNIQMEELRNKITIYPQDPILFSLSLRKNLDPSGEIDDESLWIALTDVKLNNIFNSLDEILDLKKLSISQSQLLCLARAILKKNKILVLDEVSSNVDDNTDAIIQKIIEEKFNGSTILMISHRLNNIMNCDKILIINDGKVIEYEDPRKLLQQKNRSFLKMLPYEIQETPD